jgi:hypothetical protein
MKLAPCKRCGHTPTKVAKEDRGYVVRCTCGASVWSEGAKADAVADWNAPSAPARGVALKLID